MNLTNMDFVKQDFQGLDVEDIHFSKDILFFENIFETKKCEFSLKNIYL